MVGQLRDLRAASLAALGREPDALQQAEPVAPQRTPSGPMPPVGAMTTAHSRPGQILPMVAWLPADEYAHLAEHWPDLADSAGVHDAAGNAVAHAEYRRRIERRIRDAAEAGVTGLRVAPVRWAEFCRWVEENHPGYDDPAQLRAWYAADLGRDRSRVIAWPPGRNQPCWCGSGRKYKKCCAAPGPDGPR